MNDNVQNSSAKTTPSSAIKIPSSKDLSRRLVSILGELKNQESWDKSLFLKNAKRRIDELYQEAEELMRSTDIDNGGGIKASKQLAPGVIKVYISLYQSDSNNLQSWLHTVRTLALYNVTRPTYSSEQQVREMVSSKADIQRHGYVEVLINQSDIIPIDPLPVDSLGHELLILKEGAVQLNNIVRFVHGNKKYYSIHSSGLVYEGECT